MIGVYILKNGKTGKFYIGSTGNIERRIREHFLAMKNNSHVNKNVQELWNKGFGFTEIIIPCDTLEEAREMEDQLIKSNLDSRLLLNIGMQALGGDNLTRNPDRDKIIDKMKKSLELRYGEMTPSEKRMIYGKFGPRNGMYGKTHTPEVKELIGNLHRGHKYWEGKSHTTEAKEKISRHAKTRTGSKNPFFGKEHSPETKEKIRNANLGNKPPNMRKVSVDGVIYESLNQVKRELNISPALLIHRIKSKKPKYQDYFYVE